MPGQRRQSPIRFLAASAAFAHWQDKLPAAYIELAPKRASGPILPWPSLRSRCAPLTESQNSADPGRSEATASVDFRGKYGNDL